MAHHDHTLDAHAHGEGMGVKRIWQVFGILLFITAIEFLVALGFVHHWQIVTKGPALYAFYVVLTLIKAYYIVAFFMHLKFEKKSFIITCSIVFIFIVYFIVLMLIEGDFLSTHLHEHPIYPNK
ncbi:cytochrome C oxidase subunit IV family protein [Pedobacter sp. UBA4863]|uniref:cytochrome C oxidase subunit IV family protein n=1 Tax=Pedobacter sp. UBA4863 TaxID=1947060 RepID=UPI0025D7180E|nr:cytochrome C oxidase subunit IV family protein [Pedobacter sp. UBA4863]